MERGLKTWVTGLDLDDDGNMTGFPKALQDLIQHQIWLRMQI